MKTDMTELMSGYSSDGLSGLSLNALEGALVAAGSLQDAWRAYTRPDLKRNLHGREDLHARSSGLREVDSR